MLSEGSGSVPVVQKLCSRSQLKKHIQEGDPVVDGNKKERCGFSRRPLCKFCKMPFYGEELYFHLFTEHFTCHICQREHPNQYAYYKNYDELWILQMNSTNKSKKDLKGKQDA
ncbi:hypothetical protein Ancab_038934 [Ancistrocladus abbreviatus]